MSRHGCCGRRRVQVAGAGALAPHCSMAQVVSTAPPSAAYLFIFSPPVSPSTSLILHLYRIVVLPTRPFLEYFHSPAGRAIIPQGTAALQSCARVEHLCLSKAKVRQRPDKVRQTYVRS